MSALHLYLNELKEWVFNYDGSIVPAVVSSSDSANTFRSLGLHPSGTVCIQVGPIGNIEEITLLDKTPLNELVVPRGHSLHRELTPV